jgi:hypothetical protein
MLERIAGPGDTSDATAQRFAWMIQEAGITAETGVGDPAVTERREHDAIGEWLLGQWLEYFTITLGESNDEHHPATPFVLALELHDLTDRWLSHEF